MFKRLQSIFLLSVILPLLYFPSAEANQLWVGTAHTDITPPIGTPSAGYQARQGKGMTGVHDPLLATAIVIKNENKTIAFCGIDNLGMTSELIQQIIKKVHKVPSLTHCEIFIGSSHTHSGGGAFLDIPLVGTQLAGAYDSEITGHYINKIAQAIIEAGTNLQPAKIGIGYGQVELSQYRSGYPKNAKPIWDATVIKVVDLEEKPLAVIFNYAMHPTILTKDNYLFSADFVGFARNELQHRLDNSIEAIYLNSAQADISPLLPQEYNEWEQCEKIGKKLACTVADIWENTETTQDITIRTIKEIYSFNPKPTPFGLQLPISRYDSEVNAIFLNDHAFITIPGELSCVYHRQLIDLSLSLGYKYLSILGLVNDAHGYIILPESWKYPTFESRLSFGGELYGDFIRDTAAKLLITNN